MKRKWKIYYGDKSIFSDDDGPPSKAPGMNVQVIVQIDKSHGWSTISGDDYFVWDNRGKGYKWWGVDEAGLHEYLFLYPGTKIAMHGRFIDDDAFDKILKIAKNDPDFLPKTGYRANERK